MTINEKIELLEETLDLDEGVLKESTVLEDIEGYDSMAKLSLIVMFDEEYNKRINGEIIRSFNTVGDILAAME